MSRRAAAALALAVFVFSCHPVAAETELWLHGKSWHSSNGPKSSADPWNEDNFGLGLALPTDSGARLEFGVYRNSYDRTSIYTTVSRTYRVLDTDLRLGALIGAATGYEEQGDPIAPAAAAVVQYKALRLIAAPGVAAVSFRLAKW